MFSDISQPDERAARVEKWDADQIDVELFERRTPDKNGYYTLRMQTGVQTASV